MLMGLAMVQIHLPPDAVNAKMPVADRRLPRVALRGAGKVARRLDGQRVLVLPLDQGSRGWRTASAG